MNLKNSDTQFVVVYGTLRKAFDLLLIKEIANDIKWIGTAALKGKPCDIGDYPGAKPDKNAFKTGDVFRMINPKKVLKLLDEYEGYVCII